MTLLANAAIIESGSAFTVTRFDDPAPDGCVPDDCSLREAIIAANEAEGHDSIELPAGTFALTIEGREEDLAATGDLDIADNVTLSGAGQDDTIIDGGSIDRVFQIRHSLFDIDAVNMSDLTIRNGFAQYSGGPESGLGGGVFIGRDVDIVLTDVAVEDNRATSGGGGVYSLAGATGFGSLRLIRCTVTRNAGPAGLPLTGGGGLLNHGAAVVEDTNIVENDAGLAGGGGIQNRGHLHLVHSTVARNTAGHAAGVSNGGTLTLEGTDVVANLAQIGGGGHRRGRRRSCDLEQHYR